MSARDDQRLAALRLNAEQAKARFAAAEVAYMAARDPNDPTIGWREREAYYRAQGDAGYAARALAAAEGNGKDHDAQAGYEWPEPREIVLDLPPAPEFDGNALLPKTLGEFVLDESDRMRAPPDYVAAALLVSLGSVIGARCALKPKRRDDWIVTPNLFGGVVGEPSTRKSPSVGTVLRFLDRLEARSSERHQAALKIHLAEMAAFDARKAALHNAMKMAAASKAGEDADKKMEDAKESMGDLFPPEEPKQRRFKTNDSTVAKIGDILAGSPAGLIVFRDELVGLLASWERDGNEGDRAFYLEGWNGTDSFNVDRIGRGSLFIKTLCLSVFGGIQPELMARYLSNIITSFDNDGRVQRFQVLVFPEPVEWQWVDRYPVKGAREAVRELFDRLAEFDPLQDGAAPPTDFVKLPYFEFDDQALEVFIEWSVDLHRRITAEPNAMVSQHLGKFEKLFCAVALILHLAEGRVGPVQADSAIRAAAWCSHLEKHARRVYGLTESVPVTAARTIASRLQAGKLPEGFTARDVARKGWTGIDSSQKAEAALAILDEFGWVQADELESDQPGRPTTRWYTNPKIRRAAK